MFSKKRVFLSAVAVLALGLGLARTAAADEEIPMPQPKPAQAAPVTKPVEEAPRGEAYGYQIVLTDLALVVGGAGVSAATRSPWPGVAAGVGFFTLSPIVHAVHGRGDLAGSSVLIRFLSPVIGGAGGAALGAILASPGGKTGLIWGSVLGGGGGGIIGLVAATCIDAGRGPRERLPEAPAPATLRAQPTFAVTHEGASVGVLGSF